MKPSTKENSHLTESQRTALIHLLGDDDDHVYRTIRTKLLSYGEQVSEWLRPHLLSSDPVLRRHAQEIVDHFARQNADTEFLSFCLKQGEDFDIEKGIWLLTKTQYPNVNSAAYWALLDSYATDLREKITLDDDAETVLATINELLFDRLGFTGNEENYYDPDNSYLNRVLDRRTGNPISLSMIYMMIGRRLRLPITGIGLPGHFVCRYQTSTDEFYIDTFNRGKLLSKNDCIKYLVHTNHTLEEGYLSPVSSRRTLLRICANLHQIYAQLEWPEEINRLQRYLVALAK
jgi:regulator of sirC expression with transglutaminase-like and TPR domain